MTLHCIARCCLQIDFALPKIDEICLPHSTASLNDFEDCYYPYLHNVFQHHQAGCKSLLWLDLLSFDVSAQEPGPNWHWPKCERKTLDVQLCDRSHYEMPTRVRSTLSSVSGEDRLRRQCKVVMLGYPTRYSSRDLPRTFSCHLHLHLVLIVVPELEGGGHRACWGSQQCEFPDLELWSLTGQTPRKRSLQRWSV